MKNPTATRTLDCKACHGPFERIIIGKHYQKTFRLLRGEMSYACSYKTLCRTSLYQFVLWLCWEETFFLGGEDPLAGDLLLSPLCCMVDVAGALYHKIFRQHASQVRRLARGVDLHTLSLNVMSTLWGRFFKFLEKFNSRAKSNEFFYHLFIQQKFLFFIMLVVILLSAQGPSLLRFNKRLTGCKNLLSLSLREHHQNSRLLLLSIILSCKWTSCFLNAVRYKCEVY